MNTTVSGTDDPGQRHVSQIAASSTTQHDECPVTTSNQRITYTTAQLYENITKSQWVQFFIVKDSSLKHTLFAHQEA